MKLPHTMHENNPFRFSFQSDLEQTVRKLHRHYTTPKYRLYIGGDMKRAQHTTKRKLRKLLVIR